MKTATFIKEITVWAGHAKLYKLDPPMNTDHYDGGKKTTTHVVVSAACVMGMPETYIFATDDNGKVANWGALEGSEKGDLDHERALQRAGYEVA